jgi:CBS domain-containing protein
MVDQRIDHVVVVDNKTVKGVVSSLDFVKQFVPRAPPTGEKEADAGPRL